MSLRDGLLSTSLAACLSLCSSARPSIFYRVPSQSSGSPAYRLSFQFLRNVSRASRGACSWALVPSSAPVLLSHHLAVQLCIHRDLAPMSLSPLVPACPLRRVPLPSQHILVRTRSSSFLALAGRGHFCEINVLVEDDRSIITCRPSFSGTGCLSPGGYLFSSRRRVVSPG